MKFFSSMMQCTAFLLLVGAGGCSENANDADSTDIGTDEESTVPNDTTENPYMNVITTLYDGYEELYIMTADDDPVDVCRVRYPLHTVGTPKVPCDVCEWEVVIEKGEPEVLLDQDGACANSDLALDHAALNKPSGEKIAYGFARELIGHGSILMRYDDTSGVWEMYLPANYDSKTGKLTYDRRDGICNYAATTGICGKSGEATISE